jgi:hypothetical protein
MEEPTSYLIGKGDRYSVFCEMSAEGTTNSVEFHYNGMIHTEWQKPWYMGGNNDNGFVNKVDYLTADCGSEKSLEVIGKVWRGVCFRASFVLTSVCA